MKWDVKGVWKVDGSEGGIVVDAANQRAAEAMAADRGLLAESALPSMAVAIPVASSDPGAAYGLTRPLAWIAIVAGALFAPMLFGIPLFIWGIVALAGINRAEARAMGNYPAKSDSQASAPSGGHSSMPGQ